MLSTKTLSLLLSFLTAVPALAQEPTLQQANDLLGQGRFPEAAAVFERLVALDPENGEAVFKLGYCLHAAGELDRAHDLHLAATRFPQYAALGHYNHACVHALRGEADQAFSALGDAREAGFANVHQLFQDTDMDAIREDPRFQTLLFELAPPLEREPLAGGLADDADALLDFTVGVWNVVYRAMGPDRSYTTTRFVLDVAKTRGGHGVDGDLYQPDPDGLTYLGSSLRRRDPETGKWQTRWFAPEAGALGDPAAFRVSDGRLVGEREGSDDHGAYEERIELFPVAGGGFASRTRRKYESLDHWMTVAAFDGTPLQGMRVQQPAPINSAAPEATAQLDFTLGGWSVEHDHVERDGATTTERYRVDVHPALAGFGIEADWHELREGGAAYVGSSLSFVRDGAWHREWLTPEGGEPMVLEETLTETDGGLVSVREEEDDFGRFKRRKTYRLVGEEGFDMTVERLYDGMNEWRVSTRYRFRRAGQ